MGIKTREVDNGYKKMRKALFKQGAVAVGITAQIGAAVHGSDPGKAVSILEVAIWNEFGTRRIPERSFLRSWFDNNTNKARVGTWLKKFGKAVTEGKTTWDNVLEIVGLNIVGEIQQSIANRIPPPNVPYTIKKKGSDVPLVNDGILRASITHVVKVPT